MYKPLNPTSKSDDGSEKKPKKWPDRLVAKGKDVELESGPLPVRSSLRTPLIGFITQVTHLIMWPFLGVITPFITSSGQPCRNNEMKP